jgi:uncharacterized protein (TIGR02594 family)
MTDAPWLPIAEKYVGFHETGNNQGIEHFIQLAGTGSLGDPWCAIFVNACLKEAGFPGSGSPAARSFENHPNFTQLTGPVAGCIVTRWRTSISSGLGHVYFYLGTDADGTYRALAGNENDQVLEYNEDPRYVTGFWFPKAAQVQPSPAPAPVSDARFLPCLAVVLKWEGGNDDDPRDPGGRTSRGILQREWDVWRTTHPGLPSDVWQAPQDQVVAIYKQKYWDAMLCAQMPAGVDLAAFDFGVNSGISRSAKFLQAIVGTTQDDEIGPDTIAATVKSDPASTIHQLCDKRLAFLQGLGTWPTFGKGWSNRVADVRAQALAAVGSAPTPQPTPEPPPVITTLPAPIPTQQGPTIDGATVAALLQQNMELLRELREARQAIKPPPPIPAGSTMGASFALLLPWLTTVLPQIGVALLPVVTALTAGGIKTPVPGAVLGPLVGPEATTTGMTVGATIVSTVGIGIFNWIKTKWFTPPPPAPATATDGKMS